MVFRVFYYRNSGVLLWCWHIFLKKNRYLIDWIGGPLVWFSCCSTQYKPTEATLLGYQIGPTETPKRPNKTVCFYDRDCRGLGRGRGESMYAPPNSLMMATNSSSEQDGTIRTSWLGHDSSGFEPRLRRTQEENSELELGATGEQWWIYIGG